MTETPLISVVIPARNAADTISETLDCLAVQAITDWEVIVVDDRSTDHTAAIVTARADADPRIRMIAGPGIGASAARNAGLGEARGRWLLFLDSDDWIAPDYFERMLAALDAAPGAVAAYCAFQRVMPSGAMMEPHFPRGLYHAPFPALAQSCVVSIHAMLTDRATIAALGGFDTSLLTCEDWDLWQRLARLGGTWAELDAPLAFYRMREGSLSRGSAQMNRDSRVVVARGHGPDPRVANPDPAWRDGLAGSGEMKMAWFELWTAAMDVGQSGTIGALSPVALTPDFMEAHVNTLIDGLSVGLRLAPTEFAANWPRFGAGVTELIERMATVSGDPAAARAIRYAFERKVLDYDNLAQPRPLSLTLGIRADVRRPSDVVLPDGIDTVYAYLVDGTRVFDLVYLGAVGTLDAAFWRQLGRQHLSARRRLWPLPVRAILPGARPQDRHDAELVAITGAERRTRGVTPSSRAAGSTDPKAAPRAKTTVPVLMYHSVAQDGPPGLARYRVTPQQFRDQLAWLRDHGYYAVGSDELMAGDAARPTNGGDRPVLITFDDGFCDYADNAWPALTDHGLFAEMFLVTGHVGGAAVWDSGYGAPIPLMDADTIGTLAAAGSRFGSHLATHRALNRLPTRELAEELIASRVAIEAWTGRAPVSFAAPFSVVDGRLSRLATECGYTVGYGARFGTATPDDPLIDLPRIEVRGDFTLAQFADAITGTTT